MRKLVWRPSTVRADNVVYLCGGAHSRSFIR